MSCKRGKRILSFAFLLVLVSSNSLLCQILQSRTSLQQKPPLIHKVELLNGLRLVMVQTNTAPRIALSLLIKAGSALDLPSKGGTAYLAAQGLRFANERETLEHLSEEMEDLGAELKIRVDQDSTVFQTEVPAHNLESFLDLLSHMVLRPLFQLDGIEKLKQQVITSKIESPDPVELAKEKLRSLVFGEHPYGKPNYGELRSIANVHPQDLAKFHKTYYCPNNAALVLAGDIESSRMGRLVREKLGGWVRGAKVEVELPKAPIKEAFSILVVRDKQEEVAIAFGHSGTPRVSSDYYALTAMNLILGGLGNGSRLAERFVARGINFRSLESEFQFAYFGGLFQVTSVIPSGSVTLALETILQVVEALKNSPIKESELVAAKERLLGQYAEILNSPSLVAEQLTCVELYDLASDFLVSFPNRVQEITPQRVEEVSKNYLSTSRAAAVIVGTCDSSSPELRKLGAVDITERSAGRRPN
jgi:zinc protease